MKTIVLVAILATPACGAPVTLTEATSPSQVVTAEKPASQAPAEPAKLPDEEEEDEPKWNPLKPIHKWTADMEATRLKRRQKTLEAEAKTLLARETELEAKTKEPEGGKVRLLRQQAILHTDMAEHQLKTGRLKIRMSENEAKLKKLQ